jgi:hypothetical protein
MWRSRHAQIEILTISVIEKRIYIYGNECISTRVLSRLISCHHRLWSSAIAQLHWHARKNNAAISSITPWCTPPLSCTLSRCELVSCHFAWSPWALYLWRSASQFCRVGAYAEWHDILASVWFYNQLFKIFGSHYLMFSNPSRCYALGNSIYMAPHGSLRPVSMGVS